MEVPIFEQIFGTTPAVLQQLKDDHRRVDGLFEAYDKGRGQAKKKAAQQVIKELKIHAGIEERIVYPAFRTALKDSHLLNEAFEEHHLVHILLKELGRLTLGPTFDAKFQVLKELIQHHVKEEEGEVFPAAEKEKGINWEALDRKARLIRTRRLSSSNRRPRSRSRLAA